MKKKLFQLIIALSITGLMIFGCGQNIFSENDNDIREIEETSESSGITKECMETEETPNETVIKKPVIYLYGYDSEWVTVSVALDGEIKMT